MSKRLDESHHQTNKILHYLNGQYTYEKVSSLDSEKNINENHTGRYKRKP